MSRGNVVVAVTIAVLMVVVAGCGGRSAEQRAQARRADGALLLSEVNAHANQAASAQAEAAQSTCRSEIGDFLDALEELDSRLDVGLSFQDYSDQVGDVRVAYGRMEIEELKLDCLTAAADGEAAMNRYIRANNTWNDCVSDPDCSTDSIDPKLQTQWSAASTKVASAKRELGRVGSEQAVPATYTNSVPTTSADAGTTVYGGARVLICDDPHVQRAAKEPCARLRTTLEGGVEDSEMNDLDDAVNDLNVALGLKATEG